MEKRSSSVSEDVGTRGESKPKPASQRVKRRNTSNLSSEKNDELLDQVRSLAWKGGHVRAIELASQTLGMSNPKPDVQVALLDLRSESYIAQGKLDLAAEDAQAMAQIANREKKAALKAQALNRKALVQMRMGELKAAVKAATNALKISQQTKQKKLIAQSLFRLSEAQMRIFQSESALQTGQKAIALFQELGDASGAGRTNWSVSCAYVDLRRIEESRRAAQLSLEFCQSAGDQYGIGNALNALTLTDVDIAERIQHAQQARQAFEAAGYTERQVVMHGNLALAYSELGLYPHSRRMQNEVVEDTRAMGAKAALVVQLGNLVSTEITLGSFGAARLHLQELEKLALDLGDPNQDAGFFRSRGDLSFAEGDFKTAIRDYQCAVNIAQTGYLGSENMFLTELGKAYLGNHNPFAALKATTKATNLHRTQSFAKPDGDTSQNLWWRHTQALNANKKTKEAHDAIDRAYDFLLEGIQNIRDVGLRRNYLNKVEVNRELLQFWIKDGVKRKVPKERLFAHLNIESNLREPFKRLTNTGLRLNALKSVAEIQTFLVEEATELSGGEHVLLILEKDEKLEVVQSILPRGENAARILTSIKKYINSTRLTRTVQLILPKGADHRSSSIVHARSKIIAPLIAQNQLLGYLYADMDSLYGTFDETDRDLLGMLANQGAVALDNAQWAQSLEQKVQERTTELQASNANLEHRNAELAIINSVQVALAANLDIQGIYDAVGDKIREIFHNTDLNIRIYDPKTNRVHYPYYYENGKRITIESYTWDDIGFEAHVFRTRKTLIVNENTAQAYKKYRSYVLPGTHMEKSLVFVPLVVGEQCRGLINLMDMEREHAFSESDVRLLQTLANSMSVALENARLFDETQRLLKETEERNTELQIINSIQQGLAVKLDFQAIVDLLGDKLRAIFHPASVGIRIYDPKTNLEHFPYLYENGERISVDSEPVGDKGFGPHVYRTRETLLINENMAQAYEKYRSYVLPGTQMEKSRLVVPLVVGEQARGLISLDNMEREHAFSESDVRLLQTLANSMSIALENARLFDETQSLLKETEQRAVELAAISKVSQALVAETELDSMIQLIGNQIREIFEADIVYMALLDHQTNLIHFPYQVGESFTTLRLGEGHTSRIIQTGEPLLMNTDIEERSRELGVSRIGRDALSYLGVPIKSGGETIGVISVQSTTREGLFTEDSVRLLTTIAANAGAAIHTARLHGETQRNASQMATIASVGSELSATLDLQRVIHTVAENVHNLFQATDTILRLVESDGISLHTALALGNYAEEHAADVMLLGEGITGSIAQSGIAEVIDNVDLDPRGVHIAGTPEIDEIPQTMMVAPLIAGNDTIGVISVYKDRPTGSFSQIDLDFLIGLGRQAAFAIQNATLFQNQRIARERTETLQAVTQVISRTLKLDELFDLILAELQKVVPYNSCSVQQWDGEYSVIVGGRGFPNLNELLGLRFPTVDGDLSSYVLKGRQPYILEDVSESYPYFKNPEFGGGVIHGWMGVPLIYGDQTIGMLTLDKHEKAFYTSEHAQLAMAFAAQAAVAIENARLFDTERLARQQAEVQSRQMATIANVGRDLSATLDLQKVIRTVVGNVHDLFQARDTILRLTEANGNSLRTALALGKYADQYTADVITLGKGITGGSAQSGVAEVIDDLELDPRRVHVAGTPEHYDTPQTMMVAPLIADNRNLGVLTVYRDRAEGSFSQVDLDFLIGLGRQAAIAIENSRLFDVTKRLFKEAEEARASAEQANKAKSTFLANMSHELRTPLNAIIGFTRIVRKKAEGALPEKQIENLDKVLASSEHLLGLINTVLDIAKIEAGRMDVIPARFNISSLADQCANLATPLLKPNVTLEKQVDETIGSIFSDQDKIKQIVINLLSNAAKFTHEGRILLSVQKLNGDALNISVTDSGIGIKEEALGRVFEEFQQADNTTTRQYGGTGLGLAISRNLARLLGGDLTATSKLGKGSTFTLTVPTYYGRKPAPQLDENPTSAPETKRDATKHHVLLIDDDADALYLLQEELGVSEFDVMGARSGHDGLQIAREQHPEAILLDILMPETDGWQILNDLKSDAATTSIPVILLTIVDKKALGFKLGAAEYLLKPLNPVAVLDALRRVIGGKSQSRKCALIVDDDPHVAEMLRQTLPATEFELNAAEDGEAGLQAVRRLHPDVILLDLMMPKLDGFGVIEQLNADPDLQNIPIIVISAKDLTREEARSLKESVDFVVKKQGLDTGQLIQEINAIVKR